MKLFTYTLILLYFIYFPHAKEIAVILLPLMVCLLRNQG